MKKNRRFSLAVFFCVSLLSATAFANQGSQEAWKGAPDPARFNFGLMTGLGLVDPSAGFTLIGSLATKIAHEGFIPDINDQAFIEISVGPIWALNGTAFSYSTHLRWNFALNPDWTLYALGGLGGNIRGKAQGGGWILYPRFGAGAMLHFAGNIAARAELSHEYSLVGLVFSI